MSFTTFHSEDQGQQLRMLMAGEATKRGLTTITIGCAVCGQIVRVSRMGTSRGADDYRVWDTEQHGACALCLDCDRREMRSVLSGDQARRMEAVEVSLPPEARDVLGAEEVATGWVTEDEAMALRRRVLRLQDDVHPDITFRSIDYGHRIDVWVGTGDLGRGR